MKAERKQIYFLSDVLVPVASLDLKVPFACQLRLLICYVTVEITSEWQSHRFVSNKYVSQALYQTGYKQQKWTFKNCQADKFSKSSIAIRFDLLQICPSVRSFVFAEFIKPSLKFLRVFFIISVQTSGCPE